MKMKKVKKSYIKVSLKTICNCLMKLLGCVSILGTIFVSYVVYEEYFVYNDVTGNWKVIDSICISSNPEFIGKKVEFNINLLQTGFNVTGNGEKNKFGGKNEEFRSILKIEGKIKSKTILLNFSESGKTRTSFGFFRLKISENKDRMIGEFSSTAADTKGSAIFIKL